MTSKFILHSLVSLCLSTLFLASSSFVVAAERIDKLIVEKIKDIGYATVILPPRFTLQIKSGEAFGLGKLSKNVDCSGYAITGGFMKRNPRSSIGLILIDGKEISQLSERKTGGILIVNNKEVNLHRRKNKNTWEASSGDKLQSHPILIYEGKVDTPLNDKRKANRTALGKLKNGRLFMVMAFNTDPGGISAVGLKRFALDVKKIMKSSVEWMINLDGGPSAFIRSPTRTIAPTAGVIISYLCAETAK